MTDAHARDLANAPVPWDDVRHRRVLGKIEATLQSRRDAAAQPSTGRRRGLGWATAGVGMVAAAAAALWLVLVPSPPPADDIAAAVVAPTDDVAVAAIPTIPYVVWPQLRLPDDSVAQLRHGARVDVDQHRDDLVRLSQHSGEVRYEVTPDRSRSFVVEAAGVEVRVVGTIFTVTLDEPLERLGVAVERGLVEVDDGERVARLGPGDELRLDLSDDDLLLLDPDPPVPTAPRTPRPSIETLLANADTARARGDLPRAAAALSEVVRHHPKDPRAYSASFQLGKVERARGRHSAAANAFAKCWRRAPNGALAEDARAEAAQSWSAAGHEKRARAAAENYLERYPSGTHRARMRSLLGG
ncbi:MAG: FecR domain-containing protein [Deltaproteobacteria bacterium]|nr:FecR domain-containing protein [Deltaproteobacteria bacterium]